MNTQMIVSIMQMLLTFGNLCIMAYAFSKFLTRPHDTLEQKVTSLETRVNDIEEHIRTDNENFLYLKKANKLIVTSIIALIEFEADYCMHHGDERISDDLKKAKDELYDFLAER